MTTPMASATAPPSFSPIQVHWLDTAATRRRGVTFGVPFPCGQLREPVAHLRAGAATPLPTQTWQAAAWPDGSVKWLGVAAVIDPEYTDDLALWPGEGPAPAQPVSCQRLGIEIFRRVTTGVISVDVGDRGVYLIQEAKRDDRTVTGGIRLIARRQQRGAEDRWQVTRTEDCLGRGRRVGARVGAECLADDGNRRGSQ